MPFHKLDVQWLVWANHAGHSSLADSIASAVATYGYWIWIPLLAVIVILDRQKGKLIFLTGITSWGFSSYLSETLLKPFLHRARPFSVPEIAQQLHLLVPAPPSYSFPSAAASYSFAVASVIFYFYSGWKRWLAILVAVAICYSRAYVGVHYPSDVVGGAFVGIATGVCGTVFAGRWWKQPNVPAKKNVPPKR